MEIDEDEGWKEIYNRYMKKENIKISEQAIELQKKFFPMKIYFYPDGWPEYMRLEENDYVLRMQQSMQTLMDDGFPFTLIYSYGLELKQNSPLLFPDCGVFVWEIRHELLKK